MYLRALAAFAILCITSGASAQLNDDIYRNSGNPLYWKNNMPDKDYWQQDVHYDIDANMHEDANRIEGSETLTYWNNSPDTLRYVYFHLFQNAFVKGSHLHELELVNKVKPKLGKIEAAGLGITVTGLKVDGHDVQTELDNTVMKVYLPHPLYPGGKASFTMNFDTYYDRGATRRRMAVYDAWGFTHYNGTQWFPKICVYDRKLGWDTYQHLNREFYGDFGSYDVKLNFPSNYILEATGVLQNRDEVLPDTLRQKLDIKNFAHKKWNEKPSIITPYVKGERKTWHYIANDVHDFAFTADPTYRIGTAYWNGIECVALVQEPHASGWQNAPDYIVKIIKTFSQDIGMYRYPKIVAADAQDGMEYPMLTLDGGAEPGYRGLLIHEIGHNWFYGMVGSNETYRAAMDEGFTQFLTAWGLTRIDGDEQVMGHLKSKYRRLFEEPVNALDRNVLSRYTSEELSQDEVPLNTHSDDFHSALGQGGGYGTVYFKTASMLYNLQYTLGDSLFSACMHHYFEQWKFAHPYFEDFRASVIQYSHVDLTWFFDEWFETTKTLDYGIGRIRKVSGQDSFSVRFRRKGEMQMPLDFTVTAKNGIKYKYNIPNTWFHKDTTVFEPKPLPGNAILDPCFSCGTVTLPKWYGWGTLNTKYDAHIAIPSGIKSVQIDPTFRLADKDMVDNYKTRGLPISPNAIKTKVDGGLFPQYDRRQYRLYIRPDLWWNALDGVKAGVHFEGDYLFTLYKIDATVWYNTHLLQNDNYFSVPNDGGYSKYAPVNYTFNYLSPITRNLPKLQLQINSRFLDGEWYHRIGFNWLLNDNNIVRLYGQTMWRPNSADLDYLVEPTEWSSTAQNPNSSINAEWAHHYNYFNGNGRYSITVRAPFSTNKAGAFNYSYAQLEAINNNNLDKLLIRTRIFGRYGMGSNIPYESALYISGASPEELMDDKYTRSVGFVPKDWGGISDYDVNHFQQGGGLDLRGYAGYFSPDTRNSNQFAGYMGSGGAAANVEVDVENYIPLHPRLTRRWLHVDLYGFADGGVMQLNQYNTYPFVTQATSTSILGSVHVDAGVGTAFTIKNWGIFDKAKPLTIRFDMPLFLNRPPYGNPIYGTVRYVVGINRAF